MSFTAPPTPTIRRVLIANRGEIAIRVMRTVRELGKESVAVFSDADRLAAHVLYADLAIGIGPPPARESYLDIDKILWACRTTGADAVHPGYGFLSENEDFAEACAKNGIVFIGPSAESMRIMGSKTEARKAVKAVGTPVVPGDNGPEGNGFPDAKSALLSAEKIGFPVLIKAAAGGGGKGMRLVKTAADFALSFEGAVREATSSFGDGTVYIERAVVSGRHVEIQVFGDTHGNLIHLGERDCSVQRRHQKVLEESPCPVLSAETRQKMGEAAVQAAKAVDYVGAGTCEFLLDRDGSFYFLEMNTRLQVEHPVTEMLYGLDLVAWQILVAEGKPLPLTQKEADARRRGATLQCRIYAEDPETFMPAPGTITHLRTPSGPYVRDDSCAYPGVVISPYYDPLISKLVTWGDTRAEAVARMRRALSEYSVGGIRCNLQFHRRVMEHPDFLSGNYDTGFITAHPELTEPRAIDSEAAAAAIAALASHRETTVKSMAFVPQPSQSNWQKA